MAAEIVHLRLPAFKSLRDAEVTLGPLTLLVGRNGSGKSNVIDGLAVLSALAGGATIRDALDGGRDGPLVRGGSEGCAPAGRDSFAMGCTALINRKRYTLEVEITVFLDSDQWAAHRPASWCSSLSLADRFDEGLYRHDGVGASFGVVKVRVVQGHL